MQQQQTDRGCMQPMQSAYIAILAFQFDLLPFATEQGVGHGLQDGAF